MKRFVLQLELASPLPYRRFETAPGREAQVDFGQGGWVLERIAALDGWIVDDSVYGGHLGNRCPTIRYRPTPNLSPRQSEAVADRRSFALATEKLAESYYFQSRSQEPKALEDALAESVGLRV